MPLNENTPIRSGTWMLRAISNPTSVLWMSTRLPL